MLQKHDMQTSFSLMPNRLLQIKQKRGNKVSITICFHVFIFFIMLWMLYSVRRCLYYLIRLNVISPATFTNFLPTARRMALPPTAR